jgi:hypothetical protein
MMQGCGLMSDQPETAKAGGCITLLPLTVGLFALELDLGLKSNRPGLSRPVAQDVSSPVLAIGRLARLLRESIPTCSPGSDQALRLEVEMDVRFPGSLRSVPGRMGKEPGSQTRDLRDGPSFSMRHPGIAISR